MFPSDDANDDVWSTQVTELRTTPVLSLAVQHAGTNVTLSWPNVAGFQLQSATNLHSPITWSNVTQPPFTNGVNLGVTVSASVPQKYFRLRHP
jgi:hypothetical protein